MVQLLDYVMELLRDGRWHHVHTITIELNQPEEKIWRILKFCADFDFVAFDEKGSRVKMDERFRRFLLALDETVDRGVKRS